MTKKQLLEEIQNNTEWLETTTGDEVECISIENLEGILSQFLNVKFEISQS
jgi:hypothetical protein